MIDGRYCSFIFLIIDHNKKSKMKKITKTNLQGLRQLFPVLGKEEMRCHVGGNSGGYYGDDWLNHGFGGYDPDGNYTWHSGYTQDEFDNWKGPWYGGWVYGLGYVYPDVNVYDYQGGAGFGYYSYYGENGNGTPNVHYYTQEEYDTMVANGTWNGGWVEGWGYTGKDVNSFSGNGDYYTFSDYLRSSSTSSWDFFVNNVVDMVFDVWGVTNNLNTYRNYIENAMNNVNNEMQAELLERGYGASAYLFVGTKPIIEGVNSKVRFSVYDQESGELILYKDMDVLGNMY